MRQEALARRLEALQQNSNAAQNLCEHFLRDVTIPDNAIVAGYSQYNNEMDAAPLLHALHARGCALALPVIVGKGKSLVFRAYAPDDPLAAGLMLNIQEPLNDKPLVEPTVLVVPLLAFDTKGYRLGYGGGFYDRTINVLRQKGDVLVVGVAFANQQVSEVPIGVFDAKLDAVATDKGILRF